MLTTISNKRMTTRKLDLQRPVEHLLAEKAQRMSVTAVKKNVSSSGDLKGLVGDGHGTQVGICLSIYQGRSSHQS